jgi:hypothetical protein
VDERSVENELKTGVQDLNRWIARGTESPLKWKAVLEELRARMSLAGASIRGPDVLEEEAARAWDLYTRVAQFGCRHGEGRDLRMILQVRQLCFSHAVYLSAIQHAVRSGVGSRGSSIVLDPDGKRIHSALAQKWRLAAEDPKFRAVLLETEVKSNGSVVNEWVACKPIPETDAWFETAWADFRAGNIYPAP